MRLRQQTSHDLMLSLSAQDCQDLLSHVEASSGEGCAAVTQVEVYSTTLKVRSPRVIDLAIRRASNDRLTLEGETLVWHMESETADEVADKLALALQRGYFAPSELTLVETGRGGWLQLYAEMKET